MRFVECVFSVLAVLGVVGVGRQVLFVADGRVDVEGIGRRGSGG